MPNPHFAAKNVITKGGDNIQNERINTEYGFSPCVSLQIIPHLSSNSDHISSGSYQVKKRKLLLLGHSFPPNRELKLRLLFLLVATTLTQLQIDWHFSQCPLLPGRLCKKMSSLLIHSFTHHSTNIYWVLITSHAIRCGSRCSGF